MTNHTDNNSGKKVGAIIIGGVALLAVGAAALYLVDVDQTQEAQLPTVDVSAESGQMPKFDVDVADVSIGSTDVGVNVPTVGVETETRTIEVEVPVVDAGMEEKTFSMPTIDVEKPAEDDPSDQPND